MALDLSLEAFGTVCGQAQGQLEHSDSSRSNVLSECLPFLFSLSSKEARHLCLCVSDFHSQTWQSDFSISQLEELREEVGIGGSLNDFVTYLRTALSSGNVKLMIGLDGGLARVVAQKSKGTPFISLPLRKLEGSSADDAKWSIAFANFQAKATSSFTPNHLVDI